MGILGRRYTQGRQSLSGRLLLSGLWVLFILGLELAGGGIQGETGDALALLLLLTAAFLSWLWLHQGETAADLKHLGGWLKKLIRILDSDFGIDFVGVPPFPRGFPRPLLKLLLVMGSMSALLLWQRDLFPRAAREGLVQISYTLYLLLLLGLWLALVALSLLLLLFTHASLHDLFMGARERQKPPSLRRESLTHGCLLAGLALGVLLLPENLPLWVMLGIALYVLALIAFPGGPSLIFIWRPAAGKAPRRIHLRELIGAQNLLLDLVLLALILLSRGDQLGGEAARQGAQVTSRLGILLSWTGCLGLLALAWRLSSLLLAGRFQNPATPARRHLFLHGAVPEMCRGLVPRLRADGWHVRFPPRQPEPLDIELCLSLSAPRQKLGLFKQSTWPLPVNLREAAQKPFLGRYERRLTLKLRRILVRRLRSLFREAARRSYQRGQGFWVAPHLWYIAGLSRDQAEEEPDLKEESLLAEIIGPTYRRLLPHAVRHHLFQVLTALQIDLIFLEDGISFPRFRRVLHCLFETYDIFGGKRRALEQHFQGIPGVKVMIHTLQPDRPFRREHYPEPDYQDIGRGRILHIFKDRGGETDPVAAPEDARGAPLLQTV